MNEIQTVTN